MIKICATCLKINPLPACQRRYATQIYHCAKSKIPDLEKLIAEGEFKPLRTWLNENIHKAGV